MKAKTLNNSTVKQAKDQVPDMKVVGNGDSWKLLCKASSEAEGWMKSTKAYPVPGGVVLQVTTQQRNPDGSYSLAEDIMTVPGVEIALDVNGGRKLVAYAPGAEVEFLANMVHEQRRHMFKELFATLDRHVEQEDAAEAFRSSETVQILMDIISKPYSELPLELQKHLRQWSVAAIRASRGG